MAERKSKSQRPHHAAPQPQPQGDRTPSLAEGERETVEQELQGKS